MRNAANNVLTHSLSCLISFGQRWPSVIRRNNASPWSVPAYLHGVDYFSEWALWRKGPGTKRHSPTPFHSLGAATIFFSSFFSKLLRSFYANAWSVELILFALSCERRIFYCFVRSQKSRLLLRPKLCFQWNISPNVFSQKKYCVRLTAMYRGEDNRRIVFGITASRRTKQFLILNFLDRNCFFFFSID